MLNAHGYYWCYDPEDDDVEPYLRLPTLCGRLDRQIYRGAGGFEQACGWVVERRSAAGWQVFVEGGISDTIDAAKHDCEVAVLRNLTGHEKIALAARCR
jgi:hypothetical protein